MHENDPRPCPPAPKPLSIPHFSRITALRPFSKMFNDVENTLWGILDHSVVQNISRSLISFAFACELHSSVQTTDFQWETEMAIAKLWFCGQLTIYLRILMSAWFRVGLNSKICNAKILQSNKREKTNIYFQWLLNQLKSRSCLFQKWLTSFQLELSPILLRLQSCWKIHLEPSLGLLAEATKFWLTCPKIV